MKKVSDGDYSSFGDALAKAIKDTKTHYFGFNTLSERFVFLTFMFSNCEKVKIFSNDISMFSENKKVQLTNEIGDRAEKVYSDFVDSVRRYFLNQYKLELLVDNIDDDFMNVLSEELSSLFKDNYNNGSLVISGRNTEYEAINDLNHFIVSSDKNIICFEHKDQELQVCMTNNSDICSKAERVFDMFMSLSPEQDMISPDND